MTKRGRRVRVTKRGSREGKEGRKEGGTWP